MFQKIDHLQSILDDDISCAQSFNFFQDYSNQILYLSESKTKHVYIYKMKDTKFEICKSISADQYLGDDDATRSQMMRNRAVSKKSSIRVMQTQIQKKKKKQTKAKLRIEDCDIDNQTS